MASPRVKLDSRGVREILTSAGVRADLRSRGERVASAARASAPVKTGNYRDRIDVWDATTDRAVVRVGSRAPHAHLVEARTGTMARALNAAGGA